MPFLTTDDGLVNLAQVSHAKRTHSGDFLIFTKDGKSAGTVAPRQIEQSIEQIIAPSEPYECLQIWFEKGEPWVSVSDVIAWALTPDSWVYPIAADDLSPKTENYALRRRGQERVEVPNDATYENEAAWLAEETRRAEKEEERKAAAAK